MSLDTYLTTLPDDEPGAWTCEDCGRLDCICPHCESCGRPTDSTVPACARCIEAEARGEAAHDEEPIGFDLDAAYERLGIAGTYSDGTTR